MNLVTASKMLTLLEQSQSDGESDDSYFILQRLLRAELRKGNNIETYSCAGSHQAGPFPHPTNSAKPSPEECENWLAGNKVNAIKMYRVRTGEGLYHSKKAMEAFEAQWLQEQRGQRNNAVGPEVTSCG